MKRWMYVVIAVLAILMAISAFKDNIIKFSIEKGVEEVTGLKLSMSSLKVGLIRTRIDIEGLKMYNPGGYEDKIMLEMPRIAIDYDLPSYFRGVIHFKEITVDMKEFIVEKNSKGELNLDALNIGSEGAAQPKQAESEKGEKGPGKTLQIDKLALKAGKVYYKDYSVSPPTVKEFDVDIDEEYQNITDLQSLISIIMVKTLTKTTVSQLANYGMDKLQGAISNQIMSSSQKLLGGMGGSPAVGEALGGLAQEFEKNIMSGEEK